MTIREWVEKNEKNSGESMVVVHCGEYSRRNTISGIIKALPSDIPEKTIIRVRQVKSGTYHIDLYPLLDRHKYFLV